MQPQLFTYEAIMHLLTCKASAGLVTADHHTAPPCLKRTVSGMRQDLAGIAGDVMAALDSLRPAFKWPADGAASAGVSECADMLDSPEHPAHTRQREAPASAPAPLPGQT